MWNSPKKTCFISFQCCSLQPTRLPPHAASPCTSARLPSQPRRWCAHSGRAMHTCGRAAGALGRGAACSTWGAAMPVLTYSCTPQLSRKAAGSFPTGPCLMPKVLSLPSAVLVPAGGAGRGHAWVCPPTGAAAPNPSRMGWLCTPQCLLPGRDIGHPPPPHPRRRADITRARGRVRGLFLGPILFKARGTLHRLAGRTADEKQTAAHGASVGNGEPGAGFEGRFPPRPVPGSHLRHFPTAVPGLCWCKVPAVVEVPWVQGGSRGQVRHGVQGQGAASRVPGLALVEKSGASAFWSGSGGVTPAPFSPLSPEVHCTYVTQDTQL